jgi:hypothetical protein
MCDVDGLETIFNTVFVGICMIYPHTIFYISNPSSSSIIAIELKAKYKFQEAET